MNPPILTDQQICICCGESDVHQNGHWMHCWGCDCEWQPSLARTVVVPVMTEAQAREAFDSQYTQQQFYDAAYHTFAFRYWLAALRRAGVLKP